MYGVLYAISPEVFPAKDRGTGNGLTATATRVFGIIVRSSTSYASQQLTKVAGTGHRDVREPRDGGARVCIGRADHRERSSRVAAPL